jgi:hypothetical protein
MAQLSVEFNGDSTVAQYNATAKKAAAVYHDVDAQHQAPVPGEHAQPCPGTAHGGQCH